MISYWLLSSGWLTNWNKLWIDCVNDIMHTYLMIADNYLYWCKWNIWITDIECNIVQTLCHGWNKLSYRNPQNKQQYLFCSKQCQSRKLDWLTTQWLFLWLISFVFITIDSNMGIMMFVNEFAYQVSSPIKFLFIMQIHEVLVVFPKQWTNCFDI